MITGIIKTMAAGLGLLLWAASIQASELTGKNITVTYDNGSQYSIQYGKDRLTWIGKSGGDKGRSETDEYQAFELEPESFLVRWKELDGTIVHSFINIKQKKVITSIYAPNALPILKGKIE